MRISGILIREINERHFKIFARSIGKIRMRLIQIVDTVKKKNLPVSVHHHQLPHSSPHSKMEHSKSR